MDRPRGPKLAGRRGERGALEGAQSKSENYCWAQDTAGRGPDRLTREEELTWREIRENQSVGQIVRGDRRLGGLGERGLGAQRFTPLHTPSELNCLSIKTDAGVCLCMCWGRGGLELVEIMNLGGFVFQVYLRGIFVGHLPTPNHDRRPRQTTNQERQSVTSVYGNWGAGIIRKEAAK